MHLGFKAIGLLVLCSAWTVAFPAYQSLAGMSRDEVELFIRESGSALTGALPPPPAQTDTTSKLVNDANHPYIAPGATDLRGPCPGLNTLANHGYLNRSGIVTPQDVVTAVQLGFNMEWNFAVFVTWGAFLVDGNLLTNVMSLGPKSNETGPDPPAPAIVGGLNAHAVFEGDASTTRGDFQFGDNWQFNETLFDQLEAASNQYGSGYYTQAVAAQLRYARIQDSIARNPNFVFTTPRIFTAYAESVFPYRFFVDGRDTVGQLDLTTARGFFQTGTYPSGFYRRNGTFGFSNINADILSLWASHPVSAGSNQGVGNYVTDSSDEGIVGGPCAIYTKHVSVTIPSLYPNPTGDLLTALKAGIATFYSGLIVSCTQLYPYGQ